MEDSKKRWSVTYTKHINQKRKVYQDGFLVFQISSNKQMKLYDACENLLECRVLRKDEVVSSGQSLSFNSYLVDVWDCDEDNNNKTPIELDIKKTNNGRNCVDMNRARKRPNNLSPSQKIIKEFKKHELHKYGAWKNNPDTTSTSITEWEVLYTVQLTQKAKKYHDGFLQLSNSGSASRQVMLFDGMRRLIDSRFLKKFEVIATGESIAFDGHLVDIGESEGICKQPVVKIEGNKRNDVAEPDTRHGQKICLGSNRYAKREILKSEVHTHGAAQSIDNQCITEWQVMYTTQVTQKAKKYHDGFMKLAVTGSLGRQVKLLDTSKQPLTSRFLKKDEVIQPGESMTFGGYLVQIGEPEQNHQSTENLNVQTNNCYFKTPVPKTPHSVGAGLGMSMTEKSGIMDGPNNGLQESKAIVKVVEKPQNISCSGQNADSHSSKGVSMNRPVRDAHQILSFLQKPINQESIAARSTHNEPSESLSISDARDGCDFGNASNIMSTKDKFHSHALFGKSSSQVTGDSAIGNAQQGQLKKQKTESTLRNEAFSLDGVQNSSQAVKSTSEIDDFQTFDLGF